MSAIAGGAAIGAGVGVSSVALMPFNAANTFLGSSFFGYGMILGERYMYQADWPKIQARLEHGEKIENIIQEYTGTFTAVVMKEAKIIFDSVTTEMLNLMKNALLGALPKPVQIPENAPTIGDPRRPPSPGTTPSPVNPQPPPKIVGGVKLPPVQVPGTTPITPVFIPKSYNPGIATVIQAVGGILPANNGKWAMRIHQATGIWRWMKVDYTSKTLAFYAATLAWPSPQYMIKTSGTGTYWLLK